MAKLTEVRVPDIGDFAGVEVVEVLVAVGDKVTADQSLISLESDKATMEVPSPAAGVVQTLKTKVGETVSEGDLILTLEADEAAAEPKPTEKPEPATKPEPAAKPEPAEPAKKPEPAAEAEKAAKPEPAAAPEAPEQDQAQAASPEARAPEPAAPAPPPVPYDASTVLPDKTAYASPSVRRMARELGVSLNEVDGSGRKGRITHGDVQAFVKGVMQRKGSGVVSGAAAAGAFSVLDWPKVDFSKFGAVESRPLSRIQKIAGANLSRNWVMIPHVTQHDEADITEMEAFRKANAEEAKAAGYKLTPLAFLIKACVAALKKYPDFNASIDQASGTLVLKQYFHIGVAVDTPDGLVVPVIRDCDRKSLSQLATEVVEASVRARDKKLSPTDLQGGCFSISSLGGIGGSAFTPIINAPEVAILGVSRSALKPVWDGGAFEPRLILPLSLSYDHRVIDGASAARFTSYLSQVLGDIRRLLL